jgi:hypothetical protein
MIGLQAQIPGEMVYLHTDRDVYAPLDEINIKAYLKNGYSSELTSSELFVCLLDPVGKKVAYGTFPVSGFQASGSVFLPDSIREGEYRLLGYTDQMKKGAPQAAFTRKIFIRPVKFQELFVGLSLDAPHYAPGDVAELRIHIGMQDDKPYTNDQFSYLACKNGVPYQNGIGKTDEKGNASLLVRIPSTEEEGLITISVDARSKRLTGLAALLVPADGMPLFLNFFPEGGSLIDGLDTRVAFRAQDFEGNPLEFEGLIVDQDNQPVDTLRSNPLGIGSFRLIPDRTDPLKVQITRPAGIKKEIPLPAVLPAGVQLILNSRSDHSLDFLVRTNILHSAMKLTAIAEYGGRITTRLPLVLDDTLSFRVPVDSLPGGVVTVTLLNEKNQPVASRPVFLKPALSQVTCAIMAGKGKNPAVTGLALSVKDPAGQPVESSLSVSITDAIMSPAWSRNPDVRTYFLLGPSASALPPGYFSDPARVDEALIDNLMLTRADSVTNWNRIIHPPTKIVEPLLDDFRERLIALYRPGPFEQLVAQLHKDLFFNKYMLTLKNDLPEFIDRNRDDLEAMRIIPARKTMDDRVRQQLDNGIPIVNLIKSISSCTIQDSMLIFGKGVNSMQFPKGALIVIDGTPRGSRIDVLSYYSPYDIATIRVSQKISDVLKYSGDAPAVVLITTKQAQVSVADDEPLPSGTYNPTVYWNAAVKAPRTATVLLSIPKPELKSDWRIVVQGTDESGNYVESIQHFPMGEAKK